MGTVKNRLETILSEVISIMEVDEESRNDDYRLWAKVLRKRGYAGIDGDFEFTLENIYKFDNFVDFSSVSRARRKVIENYHPEWRVDKRKMMKLYREFAKNN